jgi:hypothetical protein
MLVRVLSIRLRVKGAELADQFQVFRISLLPHFQRDLLKGPELTREEYLRIVFNQSWTFSYYSSEFHYKPDNELATDGFLIGRVGRPTMSHENMPPEDNFEETVHTAWKASVVAIDPNDHKDGQKASVQINSEVGDPEKILRRLIETINLQNDIYPYELQIQPVFNAQSFWDFANQNRGNITKLTFEFVAPNGLWSAASNLKDELSNLRDLLEINQVSTTFQSETGINTDAAPVKEAVAYAESGSGKIKAVARNKKRFSSANTPQKTILPNEQSDEPVVKRTARHLRAVLDRE